MATIARQVIPCHILEADVPAGMIMRGRAFQLAAVALVLVSLSATGFLMFHWLQPVAQLGSGSGGSSSGTPTAILFRGWPANRKPEFVLLLTAQQYGYIQPCGCSRPQKGGLERRYNFVKTLRDRGWPVIAADLGDIAQAASPQAKLKYTYSMQALKLLNYTAVGVGKNEFEMPLLDALAAYALNTPDPAVLDANLANKQANFANAIFSTKTAGGNGSPKVAFIGATGNILAKQVNFGDPGMLVFDPLQKALTGALAEAAKEGKPPLNVLLFGGERAEAKVVAQQFPQFPVILYSTAEEEPPDSADKVGNTLLIGLGHKGRYVGVVGAFRTPNGGLELHYQLVTMGEEYETPPGKDAENPILAVLQKYAEEVKSSDCLASYPKTKHPLQFTLGKNVKYVGSARCGECHPGAFKIWEGTPHSHAYKTLTEAKRPSLREFDGECIVCHVTGFKYDTGFRSAKDTELMDNGCENCHGPGSAHVKNTHDPKILAAINPFKTQPNETSVQKTQRINQLDKSCQQCHDIDNDVNWKIAKWDKIVHMMTPEESKDLRKK